MGINEARENAMRGILFIYRYTHKGGRLGIYKPSGPFIFQFKLLINRDVANAWTAVLHDISVQINKTIYSKFSDNYTHGSYTQRLASIYIILGKVQVLLMPCYVMKSLITVNIWKVSINDTILFLIDQN